MAKKSKTRPGRGSDQFIIRMPPGMRDYLAKLAGEHGRSMNAEALEALTSHVTKDIPRTGTPISLEGFFAISERLAAGVEALEQLFFDVRDVDLEPYMSDQRSEGFDLTRNQAVRKILLTYLEEHGYSRRR
jgi:plasmid stability protein